MPFLLPRVIFVEEHFQSENFTAPSSTQKTDGANSVASAHGEGGPVQVSFPITMYSGTQQISFVNATKNLFNITHCPDLGAGAANCVSLVPLVRARLICASYVVLNVSLDYQCAECRPQIVVSRSISHAGRKDGYQLVDIDGANGS